MDLERPWPNEPDFFGELTRYLDSGVPILFRHSNGAYREGHRYGLFLAPGEPGTFSVMFGIDLEDGQPAPGLQGEATTKATDSIAYAYGRSQNPSRAVALYARDLNRSIAGVTRSVELDVVLGLPPVDRPPVTLSPNELPRMPDDIPAEARPLSPVRGFIIVDIGSVDEYAVAFGDQVLGWFRADSNGIVYVSGDAPVGARAGRLLVRSNADNQSTPGLVIPGNAVVADDTMFFVADLSTTDRGGMAEPWMVGDEMSVVQIVSQLEPTS